MATVVPPPSKRQKREIAERAREQQDDLLGFVPEDAGVMRLQVIDRMTDEPLIDDVINVPVENMTPKHLDLLVNTMLEREPQDFISYRYDLEISENLHETLTANSPSVIYHRRQAGDTDHERIEKLKVQPQAVFRVQVPTRSAFSIPGHGGAILTAQFSPRTSSRLATGSGDNTARIWDCDTGTPLHTLKGHTSWVLAISWSPDETKIATGSMDNTVRLWDPLTGQQIGKNMLGHTKWIRSICWEPYHVQQEGTPRLASASKDATVRIWSANQQRIEMVLSGHTASVSAVKWGASGFIYTASDDRTIKVWKASNGTLAHTLKGHAARINQLALSTDFVLRTAYHDHTGKVELATEAEKRAKAQERYEKASTVQGKIVEKLVSASDDFTMYLWDPLSGSTKPEARMLGHQKGVNHVTFSPDGLLIASAGFDNHTKIWNARDGKFVTTLRGHVAAVYQCSFSADSRWLVTASKDSTLKVWDMRTFKLAMDLPGHKDEVYAVDWSPDGKRVGSGGKDKAVRVWRH